MQVMGDGQGQVLECATPILVRWADGSYILVHDDGAVIHYNPVKRNDGHGGFSKMVRSGS